jgi:hypothetical protein
MLTYLFAPFIYQAPVQNTTTSTTRSKAQSSLVPKGKPNETTKKVNNTMTFKQDKLPSQEPVYPTADKVIEDPLEQFNQDTENINPQEGTEGQWPTWDVKELSGKHHDNYTKMLLDTQKALETVKFDTSKYGNTTVNGHKTTAKPQINPTSFFSKYPLANCK